MKNTIITKGKILFDPDNITKKQKSQMEWQKIAMIVFEEDDDTCKYYAWFLKKAYNISLNKPIRGPHISFIKDSIHDISSGLNCSEIEAVHAWEQLKEEWDGKEIDIILDLDVRSDNIHWWLNIPQDERTELHNIRNQIGLGRPFFGLHLTIGYANERNIQQSKYILSGIKKGLIN